MSRYRMKNISTISNIAHAGSSVVLAIFSLHLPRANLMKTLK